MSKLFGLDYVRKFCKCDNCELTYYEGTTGKWPWRLYYHHQVKRFCTYRCMRDFMRRNHIQ